MKPILEISHVTKTFRIRHEQQPYLSLRDSLMNMFRRNESSSEELRALDDITFNVQQGESIGIIGKNGAGKSTLLKVLSKITPPTSGKITVRGRIASLLEVGTGFHPELTGRENIYFNGSILGMKRAEINARFDEIVEFSGTERFLDTPLKHFSSGMQLRLAFSVAAFLDPEILVIDEVLAVGDSEFQKKCIGKMDSIGRSGRTLLFVSHQLDTINQLCKKAILLEQGRIVASGPAREVVSTYQRSDRLKQQGKAIPIAEALTLSAVQFTPDKDSQNRRGEMSFVLTAHQNVRITSLVVSLVNESLVRVLSMDCRTEDFPVQLAPNGKAECRLRIDDMPVVEGVYNFELYVESSLFTGDIRTIFETEIGPVPPRNDIYIPYPREVRGYCEASYRFGVNNS